jgi:hypothetical protein
MMARIVFLLVCFSVIPVNKDFTVLHSRISVLHAGAGKSFTTIHFEIQVIAHKSSKRLAFNSFEIDNEKIPLKIMMKNGFTKEFNNGDTLTLIANKELKNKVNIKGIKNMQGNIIYKKKRKTGKYLINTFEKDNEQYAY